MPTTSTTSSLPSPLQVAVPRGRLGACDLRGRVPASPSEPVLGRSTGTCAEAGASDSASEDELVHGTAPSWHPGPLHADGRHLGFKTSESTESGPGETRAPAAHAESATGVEVGGTAPARSHAAFPLGPRSLGWPSGVSLGQPSDALPSALDRPAALVDSDHRDGTVHPVQSAASEPLEPEEAVKQDRASAEDFTPGELSQCWLGAEAEAHEECCPYDETHLPYDVSPELVDSDDDHESRRDPARLQRWA